MLHELFVANFLITAGMTASGITYNLYRLLVGEKSNFGGKVLYVGIMVIAGPNVLFNNAARALRKKECSQIAFWLAAAATGYWSLVLGMFFVQIAMVL